MLIIGALLALLSHSVPAAAQALCECDPARSETLRQRSCSLCAEAQKRSTEEVFFLKDINPTKPTRWLALPGKHLPGLHSIHEFSPAERTTLWKAAITKATELWGPLNWAVAYNGPKVRTQCHTHIHIGKFLPTAELASNFAVISRPEQIPAPKDHGIWIHPVAGKLHVHTGEQITETVLLR